MKIEVLGSGCPTCKKLFEIVKKIVKDENIDAEVEYSTDIKRIIELGFMTSPILIVNGKPMSVKSLNETTVKEAILSGENS